MENFLNQLKSRNYQNRKVGIIENGTWAPSAAKCIKENLEKMKEITIIEPTITIKSTLKQDTKETLDILAQNML